MSWLIKTTTANYESFRGNTHFGFIFHSDDCDFKQNTSVNDLGWYGSWDSNQIKGQQIQWRSGQISGKMKLSKKSNISNWQLHCLNLKHFTELTVIPLPWLNPPTASAAQNSTQIHGGQGQGWSFWQEMYILLHPIKFLTFPHFTSKIWQL